MEDALLFDSSLRQIIEDFKKEFVGLEYVRGSASNNYVVGSSVAKYFFEDNLLFNGGIQIYKKKIEGHTEDSILENGFRKSVWVSDRFEMPLVLSGDVCCMYSKDYFDELLSKYVIEEFPKDQHFSSVVFGRIFGSSLKPVREGERIWKAPNVDERIESIIRSYRR